MILISDRPTEKVKEKHGHRYEILNSVKDKDSIDVVKQRLLRSYPNYEFVEWYAALPRVISDEARQKISQSKLGKPRDEETRKKISESKKGVSQFQGKRHTPETKAKMREKKLGNQHAKATYWAHNPRTDEETRVRDRHDLPPGFQLGRDYYSTEAGLYHFKSNTKIS